ncbi:heme-binding protein soul2 [Chanos chanos]|uniref:Heme-binding protein soul2 n=1 Tax=Chanos chanos TaxID=29144 RepID=A0A6J2V8W4_CHACN|nr:heme-binding protein 2-like [Chanos chanos]
MKMFGLAVVCLIVAVSLPNGDCWENPSFCRGYPCPVYTLVNNYEGFEERLYSASRWITIDVQSTKEEDLRAGFWKLYYFTQGENKDNTMVDLTRPALVSVDEAGSERQVTVSMYITADTHLPEPIDESIRVTERPECTCYVRTFGGMAKEAEAFENLRKLQEDLRAAGKTFDDTRFDAAGYDSPWILINRHNEIWVHAA